MHVSLWKEGRDGRTIRAFRPEGTVKHTTDRAHAGGPLLCIFSFGCKTVQSSAAGAGICTVGRPWYDSLFFFSVVFIVEGNRHSCGLLMGWGVGYGGSEGHKCFSHFFSPMKAGDKEGKA